MCSLANRGAHTPVTACGSHCAVNEGPHTAIVLTYRASSTQTVAAKRLLSELVCGASGWRMAARVHCTHLGSVELLGVVLQDVVVPLQSVVQRAWASQLGHIVVHAPVHIPQLTVQAQHGRSLQHSWSAGTAVLYPLPSVAPGQSGQ